MGRGRPEAGDELSNITAPGERDSARLLQVGNSRRAAVLAKRDAELQAAYSRYTANRALGDRLEESRARSSAAGSQHGLLVGLGVSTAVVAGAALVAQRMGKFSPWIVGGGAVAIAIGGFLGFEIGGLPKLASGEIPSLGPTGPRIRQMETDLGTLRSNAREPLEKHFPTAEAMTGYGNATGLDQIVGRAFDAFDHNHDGRISLRGAARTPADETIRFDGGGPATNDRERTTKLTKELLDGRDVSLTEADVSGDGAIDREELAGAIVDLQAIRSKTTQSLAGGAATQDDDYDDYELEPEYVPRPR
ncbi:MAG: hypothetical protein JWM86_2874 [Thermoleophilia bacterium]|nr:hypothetical protein [Thermoleophilia bacterium]